MHGRISNPNNRISTRARQFGAGALEFLVASLALFPLMLGGLQMGFVYNAKSTLNQATFEAVRIGAVKHAQSGPMQEELGRRLVSFYGSSSQGNDLEQAYVKAMVDIRQPATPGRNSGSGTEVKILNPTPEAFTDFGEDIGGQRQIPNNHLRLRGTDIGATSGVHIQDANLLKVEVTYGYRLWVPLVNKLIAAVLTQADPANAHYYQADPPRLPIKSVAMVRMQSAAYPDGAMVGTTIGGSGAIGTGSDQTGNDVDNPDGQDMGGNGTPDDNGTAEENASGNPYSPITSSPVANQFCPVVLSCQSNTAALMAACERDATKCYNSYQGEAGVCPLRNTSSATPTVSSLAVSSTTAGNPINVVTGNKFQQDVDIPHLSGDLGLTFSRSYNSLDPYPIESQHYVLGHGWRHTYQLRAQVHGNGGISVVQADGRRVIFNPAAELNTYRALVATDGWLTATDDPLNKLVWHRADGYTLHFNQGGQIVRLTSPIGEFMRFTYTADEQLRQVTDPQGRQLTFEYYRNQRLKKVYDPAGKFLHYRYDQQGNLATVTNREGHSRIYHYEDQRFRHNLTGITDERGVRFATWAYDVGGRAILSQHANGVEKVTLEFGKGETYVTDSEGRKSTYLTEMREGIPLVKEVRGPGCSACGVGDVRYTYDENFQQTEVHYKDGRSIYQTFDNEGRIVQVVQNVDGVEDKRTLLSYEYERGLPMPSVVMQPSINPDDVKRTQVQYNQLNQPIRITEKGYRPLASGGFSSIERSAVFGYDDNHRLVSIDGPRTDVADIDRLQYDSSGRLTQILAADGRTQTISAYDEYGRPTTFQQGQRTPIHMTYNEAGSPLTVRQGEREIVYAYNPRGELIQVRDPDGNTIAIAYDDAGRADHYEDSDGKQINLTFSSESDLVSRSLSHVDGGLLTTIGFFYDAESRLSQVKSEKGLVLKAIDYDTQNRITQTTNQLGQVTVYQYSAVGRLMSQTAPGGAKTHLHYDDRTGELLGVTDARKNRTTHLKDDFGQTVRQISSDTGTTDFDFDAAGNLVSKTNTLGQTITYRYDEVNRLIQKATPDGISEFAYNAQGLLHKTQGPGSTEHFTYNSEQQLTSLTRVMDGHEWVTTYAYDPKTSRLFQKILPDGQTLTYRYQPNGKLESIERSSLFSRAAIVSDLNSGLDTSTVKHFTHGNGLSTTLRYDRHGVLRAIDAGNILKFQYTYDAAGRVLKQVGQQAQQEYRHEARYNDAGRLASALAGEQIFQYEYDQAGNRTNVTHLKPKTASSVYFDYVEPGQGNHIVNTETISLSKPALATQKRVARTVDASSARHNAAGSQTESKGMQFTYNSEQRPLDVISNGRIKATYVYNSWGERIKKVHFNEDDSQTVTYYLYENQQLVAEADQDGDITSQYVYVDRRPLAKLEGTSVYAIHTDHLGTPQAVTDEDQAIVWLAEYSPFGEIDLKKETITLNLRLPGQYHDHETGLYYNYLRTYDPAFGRYTTSDPMGLVDGTNTYAYAGNQPINFSDPLGLFKVDDYILAPVFGSHPIHETIIQRAFDAFNSDINHKDVFKQHTINLFIHANIITDMKMDEDHQYAIVNHFDNKYEDAARDGSNATWITESLTEVNNRRTFYANNCDGTGDNPLDMTKVLDMFGANSHALSDFYAHTNWLSDEEMGGQYTVFESHEDLGRDEVIVEQKTYIVPNGLDMQDNGNAVIWDEVYITDEGHRKYDLYSGLVNDLWEDVINGVDIYGNEDRSTHGYWAKDNEGAENFYLAEQAATRHVYTEIQKLWDASANNSQLRRFYGLTREQKKDEGYVYDTGKGSPDIHIATGSGCWLCPKWDDSDNKIEYVDKYMTDRNNDPNRQFKDFITPYETP
jgi:RHS repeat-associated protein